MASMPSGPSSCRQKPSSKGWWKRAKSIFSSRKVLKGGVTTTCCFLAAYIISSVLGTFLRSNSSKKR
ncbi:hypothetical protein D3C86_1211350 [compost metagenome]